jgi:hypothetical protein
VTAELVALAAIVVLPVGSLLVWLALMGTIVAALGASSDQELHELRLVSPRPRPS